MLLLLKLLKQYDYNINKSNLKYFLKDLYKQDRQQDFLVQSQIKHMLEDIEKLKKEEQIERARSAREMDR